MPSSQGSGANFKKGRCADPGALGERESLACQIGHKFKLCTRTVENWNSANDLILYGRGGEIATNRVEDQEITVLALHLLQVSLVYINTLMIQRVLSESAWADRMTAEDKRGLTPLVWGHVNPYGLFLLDMNTRLAIETAEVVAN